MTSKIGQARAIADALCDEVTQAIALHAMWARCAHERDVVDAVNDNKLIGGFVVARNALHMMLVITLMRLHDKRNDAASIDKLLTIIQREGAKGLHPSIKAPGVRWFDAEASAANAELDALRSGTEFRALRELRHQMLAHRSELARPTSAKFGFERIVLEKTRPIVSRLNRVTVGSEPSFDVAERACRRSANKYWGQIAKALDALKSA